LHAAGTDAVATETSSDEKKQNRNRNRKKKPAIIGKRQPSDTLTSVGGIVAAAPIVKKVVYCVDNVAVGTTSEQLQTFIDGLGVRLVTCYKASPRRSRREIREKIKPDDRIAFRVCIHAEDEEKLLHAADWPDSIVVVPWYFKPPELQRQQQGEDGEEAGKAAEAGENMEATDAQAF
jgi:hypothetical protein